MGEIRRRQDSRDPWLLLSSSNVDGRDSRVCRGRPHEHRVQHPGDRYVGDVAASSRQEPAIFDPGDPLSEQ
jgi:hypothetical protein